MKTIALCALLFLLNVGVVVSGGLNGELVILNWLSALYIVFFIIFYATQYKKTRYEWLCSYETEAGSGRVFITSDAKKLSTALILGTEDLLRKENDCSHCHVVNMQLIGVKK